MCSLKKPKLLEIVQIVQMVLKMLEINIHFIKKKKTHFSNIRNDNNQKQIAFK